MYSRIIDGQEFTFGVSGKLIMNVLVMYDRQTGSLWSQLLGEAVEGELKGTRLEFLPSWHTTWEEWKSQHPQTLALRKGFPGRFDPYQSYYQSGQAGVLGETLQDDRLHAKEFVIGVEESGISVAFPFGVLDSEPVVHHTIGELPILVVFNRQTATGVVFDRSLDGETLTFESASDATLVDSQTGSTWDRLTGEAIEGPLAGKSLRRVKSTSSFWFGWKDFYPDTELYGVES